LTLAGGDFVTVPYTFHLNDIVSFPFAGWSAAAYEQALRDEFDQLYEEGAQRRRMMSSAFTTASPVTRTGCARSTDSWRTRRSKAGRLVRPQRRDRALGAGEQCRDARPEARPANRLGPSRSAA